MTRVSVRDQLLEDYAALEYILLGDLRDLLEEPVDEQNCRWLGAILDALLDTLPREFDLEEESGYLQEVVDSFPNWSPQVDRLQQEHRELFESLQALRERVRARSDFTDFADQLRRDLRGWINSLVAHKRHETRLLQTALNLEVGTGD